VELFVKLDTLLLGRDFSKKDFIDKSKKEAQKPYYGPLGIWPFLWKNINLSDFDSFDEEKIASIRKERLEEAAKRKRAYDKRYTRR
jgi:hypothetical protein